MARRTDRRVLREAYLDTSAFIAFLDKSDSHHLIFKRLFASPPPLATSALVIAEGHGWFLRRYDRHHAAQFRFGDRNLTLADAHGLAIMKDRRSAVCWSTDRHLGLTGVELVITAGA